MKIATDISLTSRRRTAPPVWSAGYRLPSGGAHPALVLDFAEGIYGTGAPVAGFGSLVTFSRNSVARFHDASGLLASAAANAPRFAHDPATAAKLGLMVENTRSNIVPFSAYTTAEYANNSATGTNQALNALGVFPGVSVASTGLNYGRIRDYDSLALVAGKTYTASVWVLPGTAGRVELCLRTQTGLEARVEGAFGSLAVASQTLGTVSNISETNLSGGVKRISFRVSCTSTTTGDLGIGPDSSTAGQTVIALGSQLEEGLTPTSYIGTSGATVARAAESASMALGAWYPGASGTLVVPFRAPAPGTGEAAILDLSDGTSANTITLRLTSTGSVTARIVRNGVVGYTAGLAAVPGTTNLAALAFTANNCRLVVNGTLAPASAAVTIPTVTQMAIGKSSSLNGDYLNGTVKRALIYPGRALDATLTSLIA